MLFLSVLFHTACSVPSLQKGSSAVRLKAPGKTYNYRISVQFILISFFLRTHLTFLSFVLVILENILPDHDCGYFSAAES